jgi:16S rRNA (adenine1518-N6/adenine1519-N6)-dimethyltransferase
VHRPRKRFGQNFLQSPHVIDDILRAFHPQPVDNVVEIGPGLGALTKPLLQKLNTLTVIEIDRDLIEGLSHFSKQGGLLKTLLQDALTVDYAIFGEKLRLIGNLPYNISTPLLLYLLRFSPHIDDMLFMLQKEVVDRLAAHPGCKAFGRLSVIIQYHCEVEKLFSVPPTAFYPAPKVDSAMVRLVPHRISPYPAVALTDLEHVVARAFSMRRKTLANNLKPLLSQEDFAKLGIDPGLRPEQIGVNEYVQITKYIAR